MVNRSFSTWLIGYKTWAVLTTLIIITIAKKQTNKMYICTHFDTAISLMLQWQQKQYKYVCITTYQPDTKSNPHHTS